MRAPSSYWLYVLVTWKMKPELHLVEDSASELPPKERVSVV
jgi:hypothetical protein